MAKYRVTGPDGKTYEVTAPEGASEQDVMAYVQKNMAANEPPEEGPPPVSARQAEDESMAKPGLDPVDQFMQKIGVLPAIQGAQRAVSGPTTALMSGVPGSDEVAGLAGAVAGNGYAPAVERERSARAAYAEKNPKLATALQVAGGVGSLGVGGPVASSGPVLSRALQGAATGGAIGGGYGFAAGEGGLENRLMEGLKTGGLSAGVGGALPYAAEGVKGLARYLKLGKAAKQAGMSRPAYSTLNRAMQADDSLTGAGASRMKAIGPDATLADAGPNARTILDTAIQRSGPAGRIARDAIEGRVNVASSQIDDAMNRALGTPKSIRAIEKGLRQGTAASRSNAYEAAYNAPINYADDVGMKIEDIVRNRVPKSAIKAANALMRTEGERGKQILFSVADDGSLTYKSMPDVRQIDYLTRGLREVAEREAGKGKLGGTTQLGNAYSKLSRDLRGLVKESVPEYGIALETAAKPIAARQALKEGYKILRPSTTRDDVAQIVEGMSGPERAHAATGVRAYIDDVLSNVKRALTDTNMDARESLTALKTLSGRGNREKIALLVGDKKAAQLFDDIDRATAAFDLRAAVATNSKTYARQSMDDIIRNQTEGGPVNALMEGSPLKAGQQGLQTLTGRTPAVKESMADDIYTELVNALVSRRGTDAQALMRQIQSVPVELSPQQIRTLGLLEQLSRRSPAAISPAVNP